MKKVLVTGATGRTGALVLKKLRQQAEEFEAFGFARSEAKAKGKQVTKAEGESILKALILLSFSGVRPALPEREQDR